MIEGFEFKVYHPERNIDVERAKREIELIISQELMPNPELIIGQGKTADVYRDSNDPKVCYKVVKEVYDNFKNPVRKELDIHAQAEEANNENCRVPYPYIWSRVSVPKLNNNRDYLGVVEVIAMERLDAVTLKSVMEGEIPPPENFDPDRFFDSLEDFVSSMNSVSMIHHRDLHAENIMIDLETGDPRVIDFGSAVAMSGRPNENPYIEDTVSKSYKFKSDIDWVKSLRRDVTSKFDKQTIP